MNGETLKFVKFCIFQSLYFLVANWKTIDSGPNGSRPFLFSICFSFIHRLKFWSVSVVPKHWNFAKRRHIVLFGSFTERQLRKHINGAEFLATLIFTSTLLKA